MFQQTSDLRIAAMRPLLPPAILHEELPITDNASNVVAASRAACRQILNGKDDRLVVVVGPCSIHDPAAAVEYGALLKAEADRLKDDLQVVMRVYFEKPRTTVGWKGLINDPHLDNSFDINNGLRITRRLLLELADSGLSAGSEFLDTITPQFIADLISWGAIGARTTESQVHRELASGLSMPVGFKNGTDGNIQIVIDAIRAARDPHHFLSVTPQGIAAIVATKGNENCHGIMRGSNSGSNYDAASIAAAIEKLDAAGLTPSVMVDCSHGNSFKDHTRQVAVATDVASQLASGSRSIFGVMIESNLVAGNQKLGKGQGLAYGQSVTDACVEWDTTVDMLETLAKGVRTRRG